MQRRVAQLLILLFLAPMTVPGADPCVDGLSGHATEGASAPFDHRHVDRPSLASAPDIFDTLDSVSNADTPWERTLPKQADEDCACLCHSHVLLRTVDVVLRSQRVTLRSAPAPAEAPAGFHTHPFRPPRSA